MTIYQQPEDIRVFGNPVTSFPEGIDEAFDALMKQVTNGKVRSYYGLSKMDDQGKILYWAMVAEDFPGEAEKYEGETFIIPHGSYIAETVYNWHTKTESLKDVFHALMQDKRADNTKPCIEWYYSDTEMLCMLEVNTASALPAAVDATQAELKTLISALTEEQLNAIPFHNSWTAAQLATHITKSNNGIVQAMDMKGQLPERPSDKRIAELKKIFLDFTTKMKSPNFIVPPPGPYSKQQVIATLEESNTRLSNKREQVYLPEAIVHPALGEITKLELLYFVLFHTQRHLHQLKNIIVHI